MLPLGVISADRVALRGVPILRIDISKTDQRKVLEELELLDHNFCMHILHLRAARPVQQGTHKQDSHLGGPFVSPWALPTSVLCSASELAKRIFFMHGPAKQF